MGRGKSKGGRALVRTPRGKWGKGPGFVNHENLKEALGKKGAPKTMGDSLVGTNPNYSGDYREFSENCQRCVVAYEARRRGYDVEAQPTYQGDTLSRVAYVDTKGNVARGRWMGAFQDAKPKDVSAKDAGGVLNNIDKQMADYGEGSRGVVQIFYKRGRGGHVFNVERQNGKTVYIEAQTGRIKDINYTMQSVDPSMVSLVRTDNLKFSERAKRFVTPAK